MNVIGNASVVVAAATPRDLDFVARLHRVALPDGFFASLDVNFLRAYYRMFLLSPHATVLVATLHGKPVGALAGTTDDVSHLQWATRSYWWRLIIAGAAAMLRRPAVFWHFCRTRFRRYLRAALRLRRVTSDPDRARPALQAAGRTGTLMHLAVVSEARGAGVGRRLVSSYQRLAEAVGTEVLHTTSRSDEKGAASFYGRLGWVSVGQVKDVDGRSLDRMRFDL